MTRIPHRRRALTVCAFVAVLAVPAALAGCSSAPAPEPTETVIETVAPPSSPDPTPSPTQTAAGITCDELVSTSVLDDAFGGTFTLDDAFEPDADSPAGELLAGGGTACEWADGSGNTVLLAAGSPGADVTDAAESEAARAGEETDVFGSSLTAYSSGQGGTIIDVFSENGTWVHTESSLYTSPDLAEPVVSAALQEQPSG